MRFDVGILSNVSVAAAFVGLLSMIVFSPPAVSEPATASKKTKSFSVWFRAEPNEPRRRDMKADKLNRLIGSDYNEMWMSKTAIIKTVNYTYSYTHSHTHTHLL